MPRRDTHPTHGHTKLCKCGHRLSDHHNGKGCLALLDKVGHYCKCQEFVAKHGKKAA